MTKHSAWRFLGLFALVFCLSNCLVVNINVTFPEKALQTAAESIESEVRGDVIGEPTPEKGTSFVPSLFHWRIAFSFGMPSACAAEPEAEPAIDFKQTNPVIRKIVATRKERFTQLNKYLSSGYIGEATDGYLQELKEFKVPLADLAKLRKELKAENNDRKRLFGEIATINKITGKDVIKVGTVWAKTNRKMLLAAQYYMAKDGKWIKKTKEEYEKDKKELEEKEKAAQK